MFCLRISGRLCQADKQETLTTASTATRQKAARDAGVESVEKPLKGLILDS